MIDLSLDLETMGSEPGSAVVGIGACFFDTQTSAIGDSFYVAINLATAVRAGLKMDASTVMWWMGQSDAARNAIRFNTYDIGVALDMFSAFTSMRCQPNDMRVWARGPSFDCTVLGAAYRATGRDTPWRYWNERCHRTLTARNPSIEEPTREGEHHNAMDDAIHQARWLIKIAEAHRARG